MFKVKPIAGFTLVEVLVALVVLSIGLLGLAGMQLGGLRASTDAYHRTQATLLASDMADRMRANTDGLRDDNYNNITSAKPANPGCSAPACTSAQKAQLDALDWLTRLETALPAGRGMVADADDDGVFTITVMWDESRTGATGEGCSGDPDADLQCLAVSFQP